MTIPELQEYFKSANLPETVQLGPGEKITDVPAFIESHFQNLETYKGKTIAEPFYDRLVRLKEILEANPSGSLQ